MKAIARGSIGTDNPFRPGGELSKEADQIVNLIKQGKPLTPVSSPCPPNDEDMVDGGGGRLSGQSGSLEETITSGRASTAVTDSPSKLSKKEKAQQKKAEKELRKQLKANGIGSKVADRTMATTNVANGKKKKKNKQVEVTQTVVEDKNPEFAESVVLPKTEEDEEEDRKGCCNRGCTLL